METELARGAAERSSGADRPEVELASPALKSEVVAEVAVKDSPKEDLPDGDEPQGFDEAAEAAFLADARDRGELVSPAASAGKAEPVEKEEEEDRASLPALGELVGRIPTEVRETLEELYRAKFVAVRRVPANALKATGGERKS